MKKVISFILALCLCVPIAFAAVGCGKKGKAAGLYRDGKLVMSWAQIKKTYSKAFKDGGKTIDGENLSADKEESYFDDLQGELVIDSSVTKIEANSFYSCTGLTAVTLPSSIKLIDAYVFEQCKNLEKVNIPTSVTKIEERAFCGTALKSITIPSSVKTIGVSAFSETLLEYVKIGSGVQWIFVMAFISCSDLNTIVIDSVAVCNQGANSSAAGYLFDYASSADYYILKSVIDKNPQICNELSGHFTRSDGTGEYANYYKYVGSSRNN